ncbi:cyclin [Coprinopsis cinerea okayama7|uniref:Cyclin n=1 Tax=Coprinopsis cinerea (strain Okayama-7 / 130 / ATCC MYA-4618 / FGSC 9003) TaxID=240176 RepID=A8NTV5_COPC7|nr:cyclin [Coprinopsis cinerea okayama7\|eukprot:XP_001836312.2 cyclin [Coprinopsis cinerea okayama7\
MATNAARKLPQRRGIGQRVKADENAMSRHSRHGSIGASRFSAKENASKGGVVRQALGEVTAVAVNRNKDPVHKAGVGKELKEEIGMKRGRSDSTTLAQRVPLGPSRNPPMANVPQATVNMRVPSVRPKIPAAISNNRISRSSTLETVVYQDPVPAETHVRMEVEHAEDDVGHEQEVEAMVGVDVDDVPETPGAALASEEDKPERVWPEYSTQRAKRFQREVDHVRERFEDEVDMYDTTMVSEYADEIFKYMEEMEDEIMPNPDYMDGQNEITWSMRQTLVDWLLQVHLRYHMLPETLWIAINIVDRFLTKRVVSLVKLQLVGVTAMFVAAKYEEILAPSVDEFVFMTESGYTKEEILKGERIMLQTLDFRISHYCSPYSWMRKISKADDYDVQTRTLSKFLTEITLLDYRFLRVKPSMIAAIGMYCSRRMLGGDWNEAFVFYSGYTEEQLIPGFDLIISKLVEENFSKLYVCKKYANKKFLKASIFAIEWAHAHLERKHETMTLE